MGASASAQVDTMIQDSVSMINNSVQTCSPSTQSGSSLNIIQNSSCGENDVSIDGLNFSSIDTVITNNCVQTASSDNSVNQDIQNTINNTASSLSQMLQLSGSEASAITNLSENLATSIQNTYQQNCNPTSVTSQGVNIVQNNTGESGYGCLNWNGDAYSINTGDCSICPTGLNPANNVDIKALNFSSMSSATTSCVQNTSNINSVVQQLKNTITNSATATTASLMGPLVLIVLLIVLALIAPLIFGAKILVSVWFWVGLSILTIVVFGIWFAVAYFVPMWPFRGPPTKIVTMPLLQYFKDLDAGKPTVAAFGNKVLVQPIANVTDKITVSELYSFAKDFTGKALDVLDYNDPSTNKKSVTMISNSDAGTNYIAYSNSFTPTKAEKATIPPSASYFIACADGSNSTWAPNPPTTPLPSTNLLSVIQVYMNKLNCNGMNPVLVDINKTKIADLMNIPLLTTQPSS